MNKDPVRLLILDDSQNRAEELIVLLRNAGRATRAHQVVSVQDLGSKLQEQPWDLFLAREEADGISAEECLQLVQSQEKDIPFILLVDNDEPESITEGLRMGAQDVGLGSDHERLRLIIDRELTNLVLRRGKRKAESDLREAERRNQLLLDSSSAAISYVHEGMHIYVNKAYADLFGYKDVDDFAGIPIIDLIASEDQSKFKKFLTSMSDSDLLTEEFTCVASDESRILSNLSMTPAMYDSEACTQVIFRPLTDDSELEDRLKEISSQDLLTGLYNRQYFNEHLDTAVGQAAAGAQSYVLFYIAVDDFPRIRSEAGLVNADLILVDFANLLSDAVDDTQHLLARFGDNVFAMLHKGGDRADAEAFAESLRAQVEGLMSEIDGKSYDLTISTGLALITENAPQGEEIVTRAHRAADDVENGNGVSFFSAEVKMADGNSMTANSIQELVKRALDENSFKLMFQPIVSLHRDDDEQFEVLLRLIDDDDNVLLPGQFLGPADDAKLLGKIDRWVILQSIKMLSVQRAEGGKARLFINLSHRSVTDDTFLPWMSVALKAARLPSDAVICQVHESDATSYIKHAKVFFQGMSQLHCKTSINHFGCSLNPFNLLKHLTPEYVKLDGSFAQSVEDSEEKRKDLIDMVKSLQAKGVLTAISGVESPIVLGTLWEAGVNFIQGNYISEPIDAMDYDFSSEDV